MVKVARRRAKRAVRYVLRRLPFMTHPTVAVCRIFLLLTQRGVGLASPLIACDAECDARFKPPALE